MRFPGKSASSMRRENKCSGEKIREKNILCMEKKIKFFVLLRDCLMAQIKKAERKRERERTGWMKWTIRRCKESNAIGIRKAQSKKRKVYVYF